MERLQMVGVNEECYLESRYYISRIIKPNTFTKKLDLCQDDIIEVTMPFRNCVGASGGNQYARYVRIWNIRSHNVLNEFSFNNFVKMIGVNFELCNY